MKSIFIYLIVFISGCVSNVMPLKAKPSLNQLNKGQITVGDPVNNPKVLYPTKQLEGKQGGWALVKLDLDEDGNTKNIEAIDCSPVFSFCYAAEKYFSEAQYHPPAKDGNPVKVIGHYFILNFFVDDEVRNDFKQSKGGGARPDLSTVMGSMGMGSMGSDSIGIDGVRLD